MATRDTLPGSNTTARVRLVAGAGCWILGPVAWFIGQAIAQAAYVAPYSMVTKYVSVLGAARCETQAARNLYVCSPLHDAANIGFVALGVLTIAGLLLLAPVWPRSRGAAWGFGLLLLFGAGKILVGLSPEDVALGRHALGSLGIPVGSVAVLLVGSGIRSGRSYLGAASIGVGAIGLAGFVLMFAAPGLGVGAMERVADYPLPIWMAVLGFVCLWHRTRSSAAGGGADRSA